MSPCENCTLVPNPDTCTKKQCPDWQAWWIPLWEKTCLAVLRLMNRKGSNDTTRD